MRAICAVAELLVPKHEKLLLRRVNLLDDVDEIKTKFNTALGVIRSRVRQTADAVVAVTQ